VVAGPQTVIPIRFSVSEPLGYWAGKELIQDCDSLLECFDTTMLERGKTGHRKA